LQAPLFVRLIPTLLIFAFVSLGHASETDLLLSRAWPYAPYARLTDVGSGVAVVFSPDLSVPGNCRFYTALGFACFAEADWTRVLEGIHDYNSRFPGRSIRTVVLETHGTNGNGLKLQQSHELDAERSYIAVGALQEKLEPEGVRYVLISACNSGRLLRPSIYNTIDRNNGDDLFLPATCGIVDASGGWNAAGNRVTVLTPASSHIEMTVVGSVSELTNRARKLVLAASPGLKRSSEFAVSDLMMQMLTRDRRLKLRVGAGVDELSRDKNPEAASERLFARFLRRLDVMARRALTVKTVNR
jgi:hypothetical protein